MSRSICNPMMYPIKVIALLVVAIGVSACTFDRGGVALITKESVHELMQAAPFTDITDNDRWIAYYDLADRLLVYHGRACLEAPDSVGKHDIGYRVSDSIDLIDQFDEEATVFINGWEVGYSGSQDHEVLGLSVTLFNIERDGDTLYWQAVAALGDQNGDDAITICYYYTVLMWANQTDGIEATPIHSDLDSQLTYVGYEVGSTVSRRFIPGELEDTVSAPRAALPRGFGVMYTGGKDRHLLQLAFDYGETETFFDDEVSGDSDSPGTMTWKSEVIFKDNSHREFQAFKMISGMRGRSVTVDQPSLSLHPQSPVSCPGEGIYDYEEVVTVEVPFEHAIPMLTGWDLQNACDDTHLQRMGIWIADFDFYRDREKDVGILTYRLVGTLHDDSASQAFTQPKVKVSILGFNSLDSAAWLEGGKDIVKPIGNKPVIEGLGPIRSFTQ